VERVALPIVGWSARLSFLVSFLVWATVNRRRFHLIHAHSTSAGVTAALVGYVLRKPIVVKVTGMQAVTALASRGLESRLRRWLLNRSAGAVVAVSQEMAQALSKIGFNREKCILVPNAVNLQPATVDGEKAADEACAVEAASWVGDNTRHVVLYVGRVTEVKGVRRLLRAWRVLSYRHMTTLLIVGDGPLRPELEREAAAGGLETSVRFLGIRADVRPFYRLADVFVLPSETEGLSNALLEAMAAGLPVIASNVGGNREVIEHGVNGFLIDWSDTAAVARLMAMLLDDGNLRRAVGEAARRRAGCFAISTAAERYCELYRTLTMPIDHHAA
jgi:glycosyltransferase involved in cell wall biosynthesis